MRRFLTIILGFLCFTGGASAATPIYWAPAKMAKALTSLEYPQPAYGGVCKGIGKPVRHGFTGFRCSMSTPEGRLVAFARPLLAGRVCGSTISLKACKPLPKGPLPGDPRICTYHDPVHCTQDAVEQAIKDKVGPGQQTCQAVSTFVYTCQYRDAASSGVYTVRFVKGLSGWTVSVTP